MKKEIIECQYCKKILVNNNWIEQEHDRTEVDSQPCPECFEKAMKEIEAL